MHDCSIEVVYEWFSIGTAEVRPEDILVTERPYKDAHIVNFVQGFQDLRTVMHHNLSTK